MVAAASCRVDDVFCLKRNLVDFCVDLRMDGVKYRTNLMEAAKDLRLDRGWFRSKHIYVFD